jgi:hypothetical protein
MSFLPFRPLIVIRPWMIQDTMWVLVMPFLISQWLYQKVEDDYLPRLAT